MDHIVIILAALLLIGSISIAIPSRSSREISKIRMEAKLFGCKITSNLYGENQNNFISGISKNLIDNIN